MRGHNHGGPSNANAASAAAAVGASGPNAAPAASTMPATTTSARFRTKKLNPRANLKIIRASDVDPELDSVTQLPDQDNMGAITRGNDAQAIPNIESGVEHKEEKVSIT